MKRSKIKDKLIREGLKKNNGILHQGPDPNHPPPFTEKEKKNDLHAMKRILYDTGNLRIARWLFQRALKFESFTRPRS